MRVSRMRIGTRGSALALAQSGHVRALLPGGEAAHEVLVIETTGDRVLDQSLQRIGGKGVFTKEIEVALLERRVDLAVHSLKDLPTEETPGLRIGALLAREDPRDALVARDGLKLTDLPQGARIGTSSLRRRSQLLAHRGDLVVQDLRGNVPTRILRVREGRYDGVVLAAAGLSRLSLLADATELIEHSVMLPAPGQGILAVQVRTDDDETARVVEKLNDPVAAAEGAAERALLSLLGGGCLAPVGARATARDGALHVAAYVGHPEGHPSLRQEIHGQRLEEAENAGRYLAMLLIGLGAKEILDEARAGKALP